MKTVRANFRFSLRFKFTATITLVVVFTAIILTLFFIYSQKNLLKSALEKNTTDIAKRIANSNDLNISTQYNKELLQYSTDNALTEADVIYVIIYDRNSVELAESGITNAEVRDFLYHNKPDSTDPILFGKKEPKPSSYKIKGVGEVFDVMAPMVTYDQFRASIGVSLANDSVRDDERGEIVGIVRVGVTVENVSRQIDRLSKIVVFITVVVVLVSIILSLLLIKILLSPIKALTLGTKKIASGDLSYRVPLTSNDEFSDLAQSFNSMAQDLKSYVDELNNEKQDLIQLKIMLEQRSKELEETLRKMQNIQEELLRSEKFATIGRLAASVAHELRNPLASLKNISYYFSKTGIFKDEKAKKMLDMLAADVSRANKIITDLLDYSRAKKLNKLKMWMDDFMNKAILNVAMPENIKVVKAFEHFEGTLDPDKMTQVVINLVSNARDAMPEGGVIAVSVAGDKKSGNLEIKVKDSGIGMSKETSSHIFDPLFTTKLRGIGLGLSIVKEIIEAHFGTIKVESEESMGTEFIIKLPME